METVVFADTTSTLSYFGTLVAGLLTGAVGGAVISASHERAERFRDRMITTTESYADVLFKCATIFSSLRDELRAAVHHDLEAHGDLPMVDEIGVQWPSGLAYPTFRKKVEDEAVKPWRDLDRATSHLQLVFARHPAVHSIAREIGASYGRDLDILTSKQDAHRILEESGATSRERDELAASFFASASQAIRKGWL